jgi:predicted metalloendopeptidase
MEYTFIFCDSCNNSVYRGSSSVESSLKKLELYVSYFDNKVTPADDFFRFVNGAWFTNEIPNGSNLGGV